LPRVVSPGTDSSALEEIGMPKQKDLKRLVRSRMKKTGESYTAARSQLIRKKIAAKRGPALPADPAAVAGMSDDAVRAKTGKTWAGWVKALDAVDAAAMTHTQIAAHLRDNVALPPWWAQMVAVGYERLRGLRERGQGRDGVYECNKSRTYAVPVQALYEAFTKPRRRARWLPGIALTVRKATPHKSARITWPDGTSVDVGFLDKGKKSTVALQHQKIRSKDEAARLRRWWTERLDALAEVLAG
jgi:hypothetical protein